MNRITVPLHALAHARSGDKGNRSNISVIAFDPRAWEVLLAQVTEARVAELFAARRPTRTARYVLPKLHAMNFVLDDILDGGVNASLNLDTHGKALSSLMLTLPIALDATLARELGLEPAASQHLGDTP
ncbi:MAG: AtuA-related protein [Ramlibacter sp.]